MRASRRRALAAAALAALAAAVIAPAFAADIRQGFLDDALAADERGDEEALRELVASRRLVAVFTVDFLLLAEGDDNLRLAARIAKLYHEIFDDETLSARVRLFQAWSESERARHSEARALKEQGDELLGAGRFEEARTALQDAMQRFERLGDTTLRARSLHDLALTYVDGDQPSEGLKRLERAAELARRAGDRAFVANVEYSTAKALIALGELEAGREAGERALPIARESGDRMLEAAASMLLGVVSSRLGDQGEAEERYLAGIEIGSEIGAPQIEFMGWNNLANIYEYADDPEATLVALQRALEVARKGGSPYNIALAALRLAYLEMNDPGDRGRARSWLDEAAAVLAGTDLATMRARVEVARGLLSWDTGEPLRALEHLDRAEAAIEGLEAAGLVGDIHGRRCEIRFDLGDYEQAVLECGKALRAAESMQLLEAAAFSHKRLALLFDAMGDPRTALQHTAAALRFFEQLGSVEGRGEALSVLGILHDRTGDEAAAREALDAALQILDPQTSPFAHATVLLNLATVELHRGGEQNRAALEYIDRARRIGDGIGNLYVSLHADLLEAEAWIRAGQTDKADRALRRDLASDPRLIGAPDRWKIPHFEGKIREAEGRMEEALAAYERAMGEVERLRAGVRIPPWKSALLEDRIEPYRSVFRLQLERGRLEEAYTVARMAKARTFVESLETGALEDYSDMRRLPEALFPAEIAPRASLQAALRPGEVLLDFFVMQDEVLIFVVRTDGLTVNRVAVSRDELSRLVEAARRPGRPVPEDQPVTRAFEHSMSRLGRLLLEPLARDLRGIERIFLVPNGELHHVPFAALRLNESLLVREWEVSILPAAEVLLRSRRRFDSKPGPALVVGDPAAGPDFARLPGAAREARQVAGLLGETALLLVGEQARERAARAKCGFSSVIHLAAHARADPLSPSKSFIAMAPGDGDDGRWTAEEIAKTKIRASLVTLSGCRTALEVGLGGPRAAGDEREGLVRAFFKAGAGAIVANLWDVDDAVAEIVLPELYRRSRSSSPLQALSALQRDMIGGTLRDAGERTLSHPFYWAGLVAYGAGEPIATPGD